MAFERHEMYTLCTRFRFQFNLIHLAVTTSAPYGAKHTPTRIEAMNELFLYLGSDSRSTIS